MEELTHDYTEENLKKTIESIDNLLEHQNKVIRKYHELKFTMVRIQRAMQPEFWYDKVPVADRMKTVKAEIELFKQSHGREPSWFSDGRLYRIGKDSDFYHFKKEEWQKDRQKLIDEGEIPNPSPVGVPI